MLLKLLLMGLFEFSLTVTSVIIMYLVALREQPLCYMGTASVPHGNSHCAAWEQPPCRMGTATVLHGNSHCAAWEHAAWEQSPVAWEQPLHGNNHCAAWERAAWEQTPAAWEQPPCCMGTATMLHGNSHHAAREQPPCYTGTATMLHGNSHCATATMLPAEWEPYMFTC